MPSRDSKLSIVPAQIRFHHHLAELFERGPRFPSEYSFCLGRITNQQFYFSRTEERGIDADA